MKGIKTLAMAAALLVGGACVCPTSFYSKNTALSASAAESDTTVYTVNITLMQFHSEGKSMGNESMIPQAHIIADSDGTAQLQIDMIPLTYLNRLGYLGSLKKVTTVLEENKYQYPTKIETLEAAVLEEYIYVYDSFNDPESEYADANVVGKWYPKKLSIPIDFENQEDDILVQVYVPVMESIMAGGGTKFAVIDIDWDTLTETKSLVGDANGDGEFNVADVIVLQKWLLAVPDTHFADWKAVDFCEDDKLDVFDLCLMKRALIEQNTNTNESN